MKVRGDKNPGIFSIEHHPQKPGYVRVRFYENAQQYSDMEVIVWQYDEYCLDQIDRPGLADDIDANPAPYREQAKRNDTTLREQLARYVSEKWLTADDAELVYKSSGNLAVEKKLRIAQSKAALATYLETHPILWTDGEYYAITAEKQQQLASKIMAATMAQTLSTSYMLTWNSTGEVCKEWTLQDLSALAFAIDAYVTTLVTYQQTQEVAMRDAETLDALRAVSVDYDTVGSTAAGGTDAADS